MRNLLADRLRTLSVQSNDVAIQSLARDAASEVERLDALRAFLTKQLECRSTPGGGMKWSPEDVTALERVLKATP